MSDWRERMLDQLAKQSERIETQGSVLMKLLKILESQILMQKQGFDFDINIYEEKVKDLIKQLEEIKNK